ncbi:transposase, partial [Candidatus Desantisbacteria bacterium CG07_land_8_20_14_0_80_39_15]
YQGKIRQIIVTGTGRELPMVLLTNDKESTIKETITTYTHRWLIELNIGENVDFFNLNALSSPIVVKVNFDIAMTLIANTLYKLLVREIRKFQKSRPKTIFRSFIESRAKIDIEKDLITVKFEKRSFNPLIMDWVRKRQNILVPWMGNRRLRFKF